MKFHTHLVITLVAVAAFTPLAARAQDDPTVLAIGATAPMIESKMKSVDGRELSIADAAGKKGTLVIFSCNACPWARAWETRIVDIGNGWTKKGIGTIVINSNDPRVAATDDYATMQARAKQRGMRYPYVVDETSDVARAFGASHTPEVFLFDASGKLVYHGAVDDNAREPGKVKERYLVSALQAVVAGRSVALQETKSMGCSIKFRPKA
jgi:thioredoxin-related protein